MTPQQKETVFIAISDPQAAYLLERVVKSAGYQVSLFQETAAIQRELSLSPPALMVLGEQLAGIAGLEFAESALQSAPGMAIILFAGAEKQELLHNALRIGISDILCPPLKTDDILKSIQNTLTKSRLRKEWVLLEARRATSDLRRQLDDLEELARLGRSITSTLEIDDVLAAVVDAAVKMTGAEEGSLLLVDQATGELYMRAARNFQEDFVRKFRLPIQDTLAGAVLRSGQPITLDEKTPKKIKTSYLVHSLIYVPLILHGQVFGVLGVDNRLSRVGLKEHDIKLLTALAEFAVIAIENARLYDESVQERTKLDTILTGIHDGVVVIDRDQRVVFTNPVVVKAFALDGQTITGRRFTELFTQEEMRRLAGTGDQDPVERLEITVTDGRVFNALATVIPEVGMAITLHDITYLKRLDRIKSDFVSTVSHDLRSPLTAILGYVELLERVGTLNDTQREFIRRVMLSVQNITSLVNDLLNLGRIEAGLDARRENVRLDSLIQLSVEGHRKQIADKNQEISVDLPEQGLVLQANPLQMRQVLDNLLDNAAKYTRPSGKIIIRAGIKQTQIVIQVVDNGIGIPTVDLPFIFDKFYRASNISQESSGTGLGLSIVKSIVESHRGRIWVDSTVGSGSTFTLILPVVEA